MLEIELTILEIDKNEIIQKLEKLGAQKIFEWEIYDIHYDFICKKIKSLDKMWKSFRIRKKWEKFLYTVKKDVETDKNVKIKEEFEKEIDNFDDFKKNIELCGFKKVKEKIKYRISYKFGNFTFDIDDYYKIPVSLEIEGESYEKIMEMVKILNLENHKIVNFSHSKLFAHYWIFIK